MKEIAKEVGVSVTTVSHVINGTKRISEPTYNKIMECVKRHNYVPNYSAKNLRNSATKTAGLVVPSFPDSYVTRYINSISKRAKEMGYSLLFVNTDEDTDYEEETLKLLNAKMVDGIILAPSAKASKPLPYDVTFLKDSMPIVLISRRHEAFDDCPVVIQDDYQAGYDAATHLLYHNHENMGIIYAVEDISPTNDRIRGFEDALKEHGLKLPSNHIYQGYATVEGGKKAVRKLLENQPQITAIFTLNDSMTIGAISALKEMNKKVPNDVALIGFGDFPSAAVMDPPITNINLSPDILGQTAFDLLLNKINNPGYNKSKSVHLPTYLITRKSCGC